MRQITVDEAWLEKTMSRAIGLGIFGGFVIGAVTMFLICHFRWELL